jgi:hypothetical protein
MGISDEDYGRAIKDLQEIKALSAKQAEKILSVQEPYGTFKVLTEADLHNQAMKAPLSALVDMWTMRWADGWVNEKEFQEDDFWRIAMIRLTSANKLEKHNLANQYTSVYRIIE